MPEMMDHRGDMLRHEHRERPRTMKASVLLMQLREDVKAMNSAISILSQKMRHLTRNEKILGRNLVVLNKKIKQMAEQDESMEVSEAVLKKFDWLRKEIQKSNKQVEELNIVTASLSRKFVTSEELKELRYIVDSINPIELATVDQVKEIVKKALEEKGSQDIDLG